jgi:hypothetical protein
LAVLLASVLAGVGAAADGGVATAIVTASGTGIVAADERLAETGRIALDAPLAALAMFQPPDGLAFVAMRDGRVLKVDLKRAIVIAETRVGTAASAIVASSDGRYLAVAAIGPAALVVLDRDLRRERELPARDLEGRRSSAVTALVDLPGRKSFLAALPGLPEVWEVSYDDAAPPIHPGLVHDFRYGEAIPLPGKLNARRVPLDAPVDDLLPDPHGADVIASAQGAARQQVLNLHVRRRIAEIDTPAAASDGARNADGVAVPRGEALRFVDPRSWQAVADLPVHGAAVRVRAHADSRQAWAVVRGAPGGGDRLLRVDSQARRVAGEVALPGGTRVVDLVVADREQVLVLLDGPEPGLVKLDAQALVPLSRIALPVRTAVAVPAQRRAATSK